MGIGSAAQTSEMRQERTFSPPTSGRWGFAGLTSAPDPIADPAASSHAAGMEPLTTYAFRDSAFSPDGDTHVCVVERGALSKFMDVRELQRAFSGAVFYRRGFWTCYVGVWGRRNGKRLRRFLQERGASVVIERSKPDRVRLALWSTRNVRADARQLPPKVS